MEQFVKENLVTVIPLTLIMVWFAITCINGFYHKKWLYIAELAVLFVGVICDIVLAFVSTTNAETLESGIILITCAVVSALLAWPIMQEFYKHHH